MSVEELDERYVRCQDTTASWHFQVVWLLTRGHNVSQVSEATAFGGRWIEQLLARYNAEELWLILGDGVNQAADLASGATSIPSWNLTPWMTFGNWF